MTEIDQRYLTVESILTRLEALKANGHLEGKRVLTIGDADLTGLAIAIFGSPSEVVVADIDERLSELYFEASMEFDLPVRFVYHDMRIKIIAILKKQYSLVLLEPPRTKSGVEVFLSRATQILEPGLENEIVITIPTNGTTRDYFNELVASHDISITMSHEGIIEYLDGSSQADYIHLDVPESVEPWVKSHFVRPFFEHEVAMDIHKYKCICRETFKVGNGTKYTTIEELEDQGCVSCGYEGIFAYKSDIPLK